MVLGSLQVGSENAGVVSPANIVLPSVRVNATVYYHRQLFSRARDLATEGQGPLAVILAQAACEVATELAFYVLFDRQGLMHLKDSIGVRFTLLSDERPRKLYTALTKDEIQKASFWAAFKKAVALRNEIAHRGTEPRPTTITATLDAYEQFLDHIERQVPVLRSSA